MAEAKMTELAKKDYPVTREELPRDRAVALFKGMGEHYKAEIIASSQEEEATASSSMKAISGVRASRVATLRAFERPGVFSITHCRLGIDP